MAVLHLERPAHEPYCCMQQHQAYLTSRCISKWCSGASAPSQMLKH